MGENPIDARFCSACGSLLPEFAVTSFPDLVLDRYRARFVCPDCGYHGEVIRHGVHPETGDERRRLAPGGNLG